MDMKRIEKKVRSRQFGWGTTLGISWESKSLQLKHAADRLYDLYHEAQVRQIERIFAEVASGAVTDGSRTLQGKEQEDFQDCQLLTVYFLLVGYAIEDLLKGILTKRHPEFFGPGRLDKEITHHRLVDLCKQCGIALLPDEREWLIELTRYVEWRGRYPVPLQEEAMPRMIPRDHDREAKSQSLHERRTQEEIDAIYAKIWNVLHE